MLAEYSGSISDTIICSKYTPQVQLEAAEGAPQKLILPRVAPSLETLVYVPYLQYKNNDDMIDIFLTHASSFVSLKRLTLRTSYGAVIPTLPTLTHLHLINPSPSNHTISSLTSSLSSLTYLRLTSFTHLPDDLVATYIDPGYIAHMREFLWGTIPDRYPLAAAPPRKPHAPPPTPAPMVFCATSEAEFDEMVESVQEELSEADANVKLLWPVKKDWERSMPMFNLSRALQEGGWTSGEGLPSTGEWEWDADRRECVKFWWNKSRI